MAVINSVPHPSSTTPPDLCTSLMQMEANYYYRIAPNFCGQNFLSIFIIHHYFVILELSSSVLKSAALKILHDENLCLLHNSQEP